MEERILVVGSGGREHAIARSLDSSASVYGCGPIVNPGIDRIAEEYRTLDPTDPDAVVEFAEEIAATAAIIGPDPVLEAGVADALDDAGVYAFGPHQSEARIETDKVFQRRLLQEHDVPGLPQFEVFERTEDACSYIDNSDEDLAVKPAGLTGGKGVRVIGDQVDSSSAKQHLRENDFETVIVEERLTGEEYTIHAFVADGEMAVSPAIQDHNHAFEADRGPSTGGMGTYHGTSDELPFMTEDEYEQSVDIMSQVIDILDEYKGFLCGQFMVTSDGPKLIEFNARFGDPEALNLFPILETDFVDVVTSARDGEGIPEVTFQDVATVVKYAVPEGYPSDPEGGTRISLADERDDILLLYGSVEADDGELYTTTSRAFAYVGIGETIPEAERDVSAAFEKTDTAGLRVRHDIGTRELVQQRIDHMESLR